LHRELASKAFTDALLRLAADRNTHSQVKQKVLERMSTWTEQFGRNPELGIMEQAYQKLRVQQPSLMPPSKPAKKEVSPDERRKEEEELQKALALSIQDNTKPDSKAQEDGDAQRTQAQSGAQQSQQGTTAATVSRVRALYDFTPSEAGELAFRKGDVIAVLESVYKDWWKGSLRGSTGIFPLNYVEKLQDPTKEELERDAGMEGEVFGEIKNVEKLLALLSVRSEGGGSRRGEREEEEISELYQRTLAIRPKLIELIGKYSQKKGMLDLGRVLIAAHVLTFSADDFTQLNEKFIKARRDYEALLDSSMSQPQYQQQYPIRQQPSTQQMYPPQQQPGYGGPQQGPPPQAYPSQGPPSAQGYPPQQPFAQQSQQHLPPQPDVQRFYSPAPSEPPPQKQPAYGNPYPPQTGPPAVQPSNGAAAPFHFIPGGLQGAPPAQQQEIRRKPSPQALSAAPSDPYNGQNPPQAAFAGQIRPNSIHTLNSGQPQELGTGGYESPVDNRHSYPSAQQIGAFPPLQQQHPAVHQGYDSYAPPQQHAQIPQQVHSDRDGLPSRQRTHSFESPTSVYSGQQPSAGSIPPPVWDQQAPPQQPPQQPSAPPPGVPGGGQQYQAYQPAQQQQQGQRLPSGGSGGDPGDFYR